MTKIGRLGFDNFYSALLGFDSLELFEISPLGGTLFMLVLLRFLRMTC